MFWLLYRRPVALLITLTIIFPFMLIGSTSVALASDGQQSGLTGAMVQVANATKGFAATILPGLVDAFKLTALIFLGVTLFNFFKGLFAKDKVENVGEKVEKDPSALQEVVTLAIQENKSINLQEAHSAYIVTSKDGTKTLITKEEMEAIRSKSNTATSDSASGSNRDGGVEPTASNAVVYDVRIKSVFPRNLVRGYTPQTQLQYIYDVIEVAGNQRRTVVVDRVNYIPIPWNEIEAQGAVGNNVTVKLALPFELPTGQETRVVDVRFDFIGDVQTALVVENRGSSGQQNITPGTQNPSNVNAQNFTDMYNANKARVEGEAGVYENTNALTNEVVLLTQQITELSNDVKNHARSLIMTSDTWRKMCIQSQVWEGGFTLGSLVSRFLNTTHRVGPLGDAFDRAEYWATQGIEKCSLDHMILEASWESEEVREKLVRLENLVHRRDILKWQLWQMGVSI